MDIKILSATPESVEEPGLQTIDPRFSDITTLIQSGDFTGAASASESILQEGIWDIRVIGYFCYGVFLEQGVGSLCSIFRSIAELLKDSIEALGPAKNREKMTQTTLNWMMKQVLKKVQHEESSRGAPWKQWVDDVSSEEVRETQDAMAELVKVVSMVLEDLASPVQDIASKMNAWLASFAKIVYREPEESDDESEEPEAEKVERATESQLTDSFQVEVIRPEGSYHLTTLVKKMKAFEQLIERGNFSGAALVADDVNDILSDFNPRLFFPKLFIQFSMLYAENVGELSEFEEQQETAQWKAMEQFYSVDLDGFVNS